MRLNALGRSELKVSALSLGTMNFGADWHGIGALDDKQAASLLDLAIERGVNMIDTADIYGRGAAEEVLGRLLKKRRNKVLLASKVLGRMIPEDPSTGGLSARWIGRALDASLKRLNTDRLDLYMPHAWDDGVPLEESLEAFDRGVKAGKIRVLGCSNFFGSHLEEAMFVSRERGFARFEFDQVQYSLAERGQEGDLSELAAREGVSLLCWSPLAGGLLTGKYVNGSVRGRRSKPSAFPYVAPARGQAIVDLLRKVAALEGVSCAQAAIGWLLGKERVASVVLGARTPEQLSELLDAKPLSAKGQALLDRLRV